MTNVPPRRVIESYAAYDVVSQEDPTVRFRVIAESEQLAKVEALDKIGYHIVGGPEPSSQRYLLVDADDHDDVEVVLTAQCSTDSIDEALAYVKWTVEEPTLMVGGVSAAGLNVDE